MPQSEIPSRVSLILSQIREWNCFFGTLQHRESRRSVRSRLQDRRLSANQQGGRHAVPALRLLELCRRRCEQPSHHAASSNIHHRPWAGLGLSACAQPFTPEESAALNAAIADLDAQVTATQEESAQYAGGLVKTPIDLRLATLQQTRAMLDQRKQANTYGIEVTYTVDGSTFAPGTADQIAALDAEIARVK